MTLENKLEIGNGIYTKKEISRILRVPYHKVNNWLKRYWDGELGSVYSNNYSWQVDNSKAVGFHTLVEFYIMMLFSEAGVRPKQVLIAHRELAGLYSTLFPFANKEVLDGIQTDGKKIYLLIGENTITLDGSRQFNLEFIRIFFQNLDFDQDLLASRLHPMGKDSSIVVDPRRQFGHPVVGQTNIYPETIYHLYKAGESERFIAFTYEITEQEVKDAIEYCQAA